MIEALVLPKRHKPPGTATIFRWAGTPAINSYRIVPMGLWRQDGFNTDLDGIVQIGDRADAVDQ